MIHFNVPPFAGKEFEYMLEAVANHKICGDGPFTKRCDEWLEKRFGTARAMLTTSGSSALDIAVQRMRSVSHSIRVHVELICCQVILMVFSIGKTKP